MGLSPPCVETSNDSNITDWDIMFYNCSNIMQATSTLSYLGCLPLIYSLYRMFQSIPVKGLYPIVKARGPKEDLLAGILH